MLEPVLVASTSSSTMVSCVLLRGDHVRPAQLFLIEDPSPSVSWCDDSSSMGIRHAGFAGLREVFIFPRRGGWDAAGKSGSTDWPV